MELRSVSVSKCLDKKLLIFGYEVPDLLAIFFLLSILNFLFGQTTLKLFLVWLPVVALAVTLRVGKRGKPDNYLIHWFRFRIRPKYLSAFPEPTDSTSPPSRRTITTS
jgi:hypothetical protein